MIEQALYQHLQEQEALSPYLATYGGKMAIFNQEAPHDQDHDWGDGPQYGRIVFFVDLQGDPERTMGGMLTLDILCKEDEQFPEEIEPIIRPIIHGYFFSKEKFVVSAQWKNSSYFTDAAQKVTGCTLTFALLAFPTITTSEPAVVARFNAWSDEIPNLHVINLNGVRRRLACTAVTLCLSRCSRSGSGRRLVCIRSLVTSRKQHRAHKKHQHEHK